MRLYILTGIVSFLLGLLLSLLSYIPFEWIVILLIISFIGIKFLLQSNVLPTSQIKFGLTFLLPKLIQHLSKSTKEKKIVKIDSNKVIIEYEHKGNLRYHVVPYSRRNLAKHSKYTVHLIEHDNTEIEITQIPGTLYNHSPSEFNSKAIRVTNKLTKEHILYEGDDIPKLK